MTIIAVHSRIPGSRQRCERSCFRELVPMSVSRKAAMLFCVGGDWMRG